MKAGLLAASAVAFAQLAIAQPHGHRHIHQQRDAAQATATVVLPEVVVYVDQAGNTLAAETKATPTPTPEPTPTPTPTPQPQQAYVQSEEPPAAAPTSEAPPPSTQPEAPAQSPPSNGGSSGGSSGGDYSALASAKGATYSPYNPDGTCKDTGSVESDIANLAGMGFNAIRIYGVDCNQVANSVPAAKKHGLKIIAGVFNIGSVSSDLSSMSQQLGSDFSALDAITVYNEPINQGRLDAGSVAAAIREAKGYLSSTNFKGGVAGVDTFNQLANPSNGAVIEASDFVAANCHPWFDPQTAPSGASSFVENSCIGPLKAVAGGKPVVITESGWPCGNPGGGMGNNVASPEAQSTAIGQLRSLSGLFAFSYTSTKWHKEPWSVENNWGWNDC